MLMLVVFAGLAFAGSMHCLCGILHCSTPDCCLEEARADVRYRISTERFEACRGDASELRPSSANRKPDHGSGDGYT